MGASSGAAASYVANLGYQLNDIGMMLSMGQSPFMLMMQQGPQVVQVFGQMRAAGMQIGPAIASAFTSMLNPLSFATMAVIGFGAAALQWFTGAGEKAKSLEDAISELESRVRSYRSAVDDVLTPMGELRKEWGAQAGEIRELSQAMMLLERVRALKALSEGVASIRSEFSGLKGDLETIANMEASVASARQAVDLGVRGPEAVINALEQQKGIIEGIREEYGLTVDQAKQLQAALDGLGAAKGPQETSAALGQVREVLTAILSRGGEFPASFLAAAEQILGAEEAARLLSRSLETGAGSAQSLARVDMASGIAAAGRQARILAADLGVSLGVALQLQNINGSADPAKVTPKPRIGFGPGVGRAPDPVYGGVPVLGFGPNSGSPRPVTRDPRFNPEGGPGQVFTDDVPGAGRGGAGGGAKEADEVAEALKRQRQALEDLKVSEQQQIAMMLETDPVQREILRNHEALKGVVGEEREEVEKLIAERMRLEEVKSRIEEIGRAGESAFVGLVTGAHSFRDAISMLIGKLAEMAASAAWDSLWGGIGGGLFSGLFGGGGGSTGDTGIFGLGMPMADGGMVMGPGGPRDDKVAAWLSNGEYVVNASATAQHLPLIEAMNSGASMADLAAIIGGARPAWPAFADGGLFGSVNGSAAPSGWGLSGSRAGGGMSGGMGMTRVSVDVRAYFDDREGKMMAEVQRVSQEVAVATTTEGLETFSAHHLPARIAEIDANPRIYG
nr:phage tail length tape measure family protein [Paracoccus sp. IB05]